MGLFDSPAGQLEDFLAQNRASGRVRELPLDAVGDWPEESSLILEENTALELGNPSLGSLSFLLWREGEGEDGDKVLLLGPDLQEMKAKREPFAQILFVRGRFQDEYECYQELRATVYETRLRGLMSRVLPSRQIIWSRVTREALADGFSLAHLGKALIRNLKAKDFVSRVWALFVTSSRQEIAGLESMAREVAGIAGAMLKMNEEMSYDCETCEFGEVCDKVVELKQIREKLMEKKSR